MNPLSFSLAAALLASPLLAHAASHHLTPTADTYFEAYGSEKKNFGTEPVLRIDQWEGRQVFLKFSLKELPASQFVSRATLRLFITEVGFNEAGELPELPTCVGVYDVVTPWTETGLTFNSPDGQHHWNQGPGIRGAGYTDVGPLKPRDVGVHLRRPAVALEPAKAKANSWLEVDLTDFVRQRLQAGEPEVSVLIKASTLGRGYTFRSREAEQVRERPALEVETLEYVTAYVLKDVVVTDWTPRARVKLPATTATPQTGTISLTRKPRSSEVRPEAMRAENGGLFFTPDRPGQYQVEAGPLVGIETGASAYVLSVPPHPRMYVTPESLAQMRVGVSRGDRLTKAFLSWVDAGQKGADAGKFHDMGPHEGCENTALAWLITQDRRFLSNSIAYAGKVLAKPMRSHFADVHAATFLGAAWVQAMALHYDWCYDQLPENQRRAVADWLKEAATWGWERSGAPIAHNDGGARQCLLASAALALLRDDPDAEQMYIRSRENFNQRMLPWLNDGGRGGRSGDGGEYEGLHGFYIVRYAWMSQTATGEDIFLESPFFFNRLNHVLFGWYPRRLVERTGAYSMRQYYSPSGDHTRLGYVGDTQPYQSAAALCARFRDTPEAQGVRWLAGDWPTSWMQYTLRWAVLGGFENLPAREPKELAYLDPGCNTVFMRSDWSDDATWVLFENAPFVSAHGSLDSGTFEIFKGDILAARTGNLDHANVGASHTMNYLHRSIAANCLLIRDPVEKWKGFLGGAEGGNDGGGQRTNYPLGSSPDADTYVTYRDLFQRGQVTRFLNTNGITYAAVDLTPAYNNPAFHGGKLNRAKVSNVFRQLLYLRGVDAVLVFDRVGSTSPEYKKTWLLHSLGDLEVLDGKETKVDDGEFHYSGARRAVIRYGWPKPVPSFGRCLSVTLLPNDAQVTKIGGRVALPDGKTEAFPGDQWHGQHTHRHLKDFWVNGANYPPGNPPETRWFGEPGSRYYVAGTPDETGGRGKWRLEVSPPAASTNDVFFHVLCPRLGLEGDFPTVRPISADRFTGALVSDGRKNAAAFFNQSENSEKEFKALLPAEISWAVVVMDMQPGSYAVQVGGSERQRIQIGTDGILMLERVSGEVRVYRP